eukprot:gnl/TRDRNA2_/TRDRNA2_187526_c0_seq1.p1 gnl/TRDRNA2_/TRDRNA2_187526_c0~~gnl/TRDRNA2_/TRDRNA2_187526_c0_seq1.p1  ORF type:complete len:312 (+),score=20.14 gnl/TRDRNA2_/TRDRNA2_187526_c0_seq1:52-987(+)
MGSFNIPLMMLVTMCSTTLTKSAPQRDVEDDDGAVMLQANTSATDEHNRATNIPLTHSMKQHIQTHYDDRCETHFEITLANLESAGHQCPSPNPLNESYDVCSVMIRHLYQEWVMDLPDGLDAGEGETCLAGRTGAHIVTRLIQRACWPESDYRHALQEKLVDDLARRDCHCYGDSDGPCGKFVAEGHPLANYTSCMQSYYQAWHGEALPDDEEACATARRTNPDVDVAIRGVESSLRADGVTDATFNLLLKDAHDYLEQRVAARVSQAEIGRWKSDTHLSQLAQHGLPSLVQQPEIHTLVTVLLPDSTWP